MAVMQDKQSALIAKPHHAVRTAVAMLEVPGLRLIISISLQWTCSRLQSHSLPKRTYKNC
jgi:hypothetical protein